jgi:hypothetical protein
MEGGGHQRLSGGPALIFGFQWIFAIVAPSGNGLPLPGTPDLNASIIAGFPRITAIRSAFLLIEIVCQVS